MHSDGLMDQPVTITRHRRDTGEEYEQQSYVGAGVHSTYESKMVDKKWREIVDGVASEIDAMPEPLAAIEDGKGAAEATVELMDRAAARLPPTKLIETYVSAGGKPNNATIEALWHDWGDATIKTMADGARVLAWIWECTWKQGNGDALPPDALIALELKKLQQVYTEDDTFVPSLDLDHIDEQLKSAHD
jgi:hypothetical protein